MCGDEVNWYLKMEKRILSGAGEGDEEKEVRVLTCNNSDTATK
jgi:hypothetical protein